MHREIRYKDITRQSFQQRFIRKLITTTNTMALLVRIGVVVVLVEGIMVGFAVDFGISCLAFVVDIVVVEIVEIAEVARESKGNRIGVSYQTREGVRGFYKENELGKVPGIDLLERHLCPTRTDVAIIAHSLSHGAVLGYCETKLTKLVFLTSVAVDDLGFPAVPHASLPS
ncbi:hypothetical protein Tco_0893540 [Tanacetum coccineum]|uniref:Uncharacterized protein n=1 Tax=Tanacetum coccineum TaxID=301880 RepID=A0ABQ5CAF4_9ASTR